MGIIQLVVRLKLNIHATCCQPLIFLSSLLKGRERSSTQGNMLLDYIKAWSKVGRMLKATLLNVVYVGLYVNLMLHPVVHTYNR